MFIESYIFIMCDVKTTNHEVCRVIVKIKDNIYIYQWLILVKNDIIATDFPD